jgi:hypothetical protein
MSSWQRFEVLCGCVVSCLLFGFVGLIMMGVIADRRCLAWVTVVLTQNDGFTFALGLTAILNLDNHIYLIEI